MPVFSSILCAVDRSPLASRVLRHAAGLAGLCDAELTLLGVSDDDTREYQAELTRLIESSLPYGASYLKVPRVRVVRITQGHPADAIVELARTGYDLVVAGTHARTGLARWFLGSTSAALLERAPCPTLLVPPGDTQMVTLDTNRVLLNVGAVLAAVDLAEPNPAQLSLAAALASLARQPLVVMTVADDLTTDEAAARQLREWSDPLATDVAHHIVVRRGAIADEIHRAAVAEPAGLVVMGLRGPGHGMPGEIATAVLRSKDALVLAVPPA